MDDTQQKLIVAFTNYFLVGRSFKTIVDARAEAITILSKPVIPGTPEAKLVDESIEQGLVWASRQLVRQLDDPIQAWEKCLDLYDRQPGLNTRTSTSILQQAYSTPIPIAYLAGKLAGVNRETTVYEPTAGNGALLLLADPQKAIVNEINPNRAAALRAQGFTVTQQDASTFLPSVEPVDRIITNPPFGSLKDTQGLTRTFRRGLLTTSQLDHAIALTALDLMKPQGRAVLILGGKMGDERSRTERYNTQLTRGFYRWLYQDAGYKVVDHFSLAGSLYRKQGTTFPIDVIVIEGIGETQLRLPGVQPPRVYESYEALKEVLIHAVQQQHKHEPKRNFGVTLRGIYAGSSVDTDIHDKYFSSTAPSVDNSSSSTSVEPNREQGGILFPADATGGMANRTINPRLVNELRPSRRVGSAGMGGAGDKPVSTDVPEQSLWSASSEANGFLPSDELSGATAAMPNTRAAVSDSSASGSGARSELSRGHEFNRLVDVDEHGREPALLSGLAAMSESELTPPINLEAFPEQDIENQVAYKPRSKASTLSTLAPAASLKGLENAFDKIEATTGMSVDEYVRTRLNEPSLEELFKHYAAEQIDSLALSIYNHEFENKATLIGHDTGIGKTRIICGLARYAQQQEMIPTIVTADSVLYADILARDGVDTGNNFNPLITNNDLNISLRSTDGRQIGEIRTPQNHGNKIKEYAQLGNIGQHDCVFTTYGQLTGPASVDRRELLSALAPRSFLILDESHKAGGAAGEQRPKTLAEKAREQSKAYVPSCTEFFQQLVTQTQGFVASSATAIKDPIIASRLFYETTDLKLAAPDKDTFTEHLKAGGVPLQQMVFSMWAESGGCIRCEKSYEGVEFGVAKVPVSLQTAENNSKILNLIWRFDRIKEDVVEKISADFAASGEAAQAKNPALGDAGATSTIFTSVLHNLTAVTALGLKAEETANAVIADIEQGRKPTIMLFNTMESTIKNFIDTHNELADAHNTQFPELPPMKRIKVGDTININAGELFTRYLEKSRTIKITEPYLDELTGKQVTRSHRLTDEELGEIGVTAFNRAEAAIATADWSQLPISPIDYIKQKIEDAGHSIGEITGRTNILKYESATELAAGVVTYGTREHGTAQKKQVMDDFQNGRVDAVITNSTTGYSLHAARTVADQRQRVMYIVQPHLDVNQVEQSIGRSHRSGQVNPALHSPDRLDEQGRPQWGEYDGTFGLPIFKLVVGQDLPTEERAVAILMKKMSHLKANTTGNRSSSFGLKEMPDFVNDYGNEVAASLMEQNLELHADLDYPLGDGEELSDPKAIQKVTGRAVILTSEQRSTPENPYPSLARQAWLYDTLTSEYKEFLAQKIALGENELEAQKIDLQAEPVSRLVLNPGSPEIDSPFTKPAYLVEVLALTGAKPNTTLQVVNAVRSELGFETISNLADHDDYERSDVREKGRERTQETVEQLRDSAGEFLDAHTLVKEAEITVVRGRVEKYQQRLDAQLTISSDLQQRLSGSETFGNTTLSDQLKAQLGQQQPKIDKLRTQLSKAQLDLNGKEFQLAKYQRIAKATCEDVSQLLSQFPIGQGVCLIDTKTKNFLYGVVAGVEQKNRANNPASPSNWKLKLLVVDGVRSVSIRLDSLLKDKKQLLEPVETAPSFRNFKEESSIYELFDQRQTEGKERRYLVSGQVLSSQLTGKFAQVTDNEGRVHPVYLLRRGFDPEQDLDVKPVKLEKLELIKQFLFEATGKIGVVQTTDQNLTILADIRTANLGGIVLKTPRTISQGGLYFKDDGLLQLTGDFVSKTESVREGNTTKSQSIMTVTVPAGVTDEVLSYISGKWGVGAASNKNVARELLGQVLPSWEPCNAINPDVERLPVQRTPQITASTRNALQRAFDTNSPSWNNTNSERQSVEPKQRSSELGGLRSPDLSAIYEPEPILEAPAATTAISLEVPNTQSSKQIATPNNQHGSAEKNVAKLLHQAGLAAEILTGEDFYLKVKNDPYIPLSVERQNQELYLTHFLEDGSGDLFIDSEMVFNISPQGQLTLTETAVQNLLTGGEYRRNDKQFAKTFSNNLLEQGFAEAALRRLQEKQQVSVPIQAESPVTSSGVTEVAAHKLAAAFDGEVIECVTSNEPPLPKSDYQAAIPSVIRSDYREPSLPLVVEETQLSLFDLGLNNVNSPKQPSPLPLTVSPQVLNQTSIQTPATQPAVQALSQNPALPPLQDIPVVEQELTQAPVAKPHLSSNVQQLESASTQNITTVRTQYTVTEHRESFSEQANQIHDIDLKTVALDVGLELVTKDKPKYLALPLKDETQWSDVQKYLVETRGLPEPLVNNAHQLGLLYADPQCNAVFLRHEQDNWERGERTGAILLGTRGDFRGLSPSCEIDKGGFWFSLGKGKVQRVVLVHSAIDALSFAALDKSNYQKNKTVYLSTDGAGTIPIKDLQVVAERGGQVIVGFDADRAGEQMAWKVAQSLPKVTRLQPTCAKDWNEQLLGNNKSSLSVDNPVEWSRIAKALGKPENYVNRVTEVVTAFKAGQPLSEKATTAMHCDLDTYKQSVDSLWKWHGAAYTLGKSSQYLNRISEVALAFNADKPTPLSAEAVATMQRDLSVHQVVNTSQKILQHLGKPTGNANGELLFRGKNFYQVQGVLNDFRLDCHDRGLILAVSQGRVQKSDLTTDDFKRFQLLGQKLEVDIAKSKEVSLTTNLGKNCNLEVGD